MMRMMEPKKPISVNYLYFGALFALLLLTSTGSVLLKEHLAGSRLFFWFYAVGQSALEVIAFTFIGWLIHRLLGKVGFWVFIGTTFLFFFLHAFDFLMDLVLDLSVWESIIAFVFDESLGNFFYLLDASGIPLWVWGLFFGALALLPVAGVFIYRATHWLSQKRGGLEVRPETFLQLFICIPAALFFWDYSASCIIRPDAYTEFTKSLPWKHTFLQPSAVRLSVQGELKKPLEEEKLAQAIQAFDGIATHKPNVFLFVVESLRSDIITPEIAPYLSRFRDENISGQVPLSNANGTHLSWFSIFHSQFSYSWSRVKNESRKMGSPALALFKKLGYQIRLYSAAQLNYYGMESLLFGENAQLLNSYQTFHHGEKKAPFESDAEAVHAVEKDLAANPELSQGQVFIIFLDSSHFGYSWDEKTPSKFAPFAKEFAYFKAIGSRKNIELVKNRYRNAVNYIDSLFGNFLTKAPQDALIAFTGDHGEEFLDHGHLFHGSHLTHEQTSVPLFMKIGTEKKQVALLSQMDIMPTLLDQITGKTASFLEGESALREKQWPFAVISRFNASRSPQEICLHNGRNKLIARFADCHRIFETKELQILSLRDVNDVPIQAASKDLEPWIQREFGPALSRLFPKD
ncbi:MAG TPA: sulfatase-like hydrolase/transferase [Chlamydiales bacterium]